MTGRKWGVSMTKLILGSTVIAAFLGATLSTMTHLSTPRMVEQGGQLHVKGIGFESGAPVEVCIGSSDCSSTTPDAHGGFAEIRRAPDALGPVVITAIQTFNGARRSVGSRTLRASAVTFVIEERGDPFRVKIDRGGR